MRTSSVIGGLLLLLAVNNALAYVDVMRVDCSNNNEMCTDPMCTITKKMRNRLTLYDVGCFFPRSMDNLTARMTLYQKRGKRFERYFLDASENYCEVLETTTKNKFLAYILNPVIIYFKHWHCPLVGNVTALKVPMKFDLAPGMFPNRLYILRIALYKEDIFIFAENITFRVV